MSALRQWVKRKRRRQPADSSTACPKSAALYQQGKAGFYRDPGAGDIAMAWREIETAQRRLGRAVSSGGFATAIRFLEASQQASVAEEQAREAARQRELEQAQQLAEAQQLRLEQQQRAARKLRTMIAGLAVVAIVAAIWPARPRSSPTRGRTTWRPLPGRRRQPPRPAP